MVDELPGVLYTYRTTHKTAIGETPFALAFCHEAVVLAEIMISIHRIEYFNEEQNDEQMCLNQDLLAEKREITTEYHYRVATIRTRMCECSQFRWVNQSTKDSSQGVFGLNWERPYRIL